MTDATAWLVVSAVANLATLTAIVVLLSVARGAARDLTTARHDLTTAVRLARVLHDRPAEPESPNVSRETLELEPDSALRPDVGPRP